MLWNFRAEGNLATVNYFIIGFVCACLAADSETKLKKSTAKPHSTATAEKKDPLEEEYDKLIELDEAALKDVQKLTAEAEAFGTKGAAESKAVLAAKIDQRLEPVK